MQDQTQYMITLAQRCSEATQKTQDELTQKYLQPLHTAAKHYDKEHMEDYMAQIERLHRGQRV